jgi:hypothetical protein
MSVRRAYTSWIPAGTGRPDEGFCGSQFCQTVATAIPYLNKAVHTITYTAPDVLIILHTV